MNPVRDLWGGIGAAFGDQRVRVLVTMTTILIAIASTFYHLVEGWRWLDSVYFSVITIATVGYGDFSPKTDLGKLFTIFYVLTGLGLFVATATAIADNIISRTDRNEGN
jgi:voltage-gated potassium channel